MTTPITTPIKKLSTAIRLIRLHRPPTPGIAALALLLGVTGASVLGSGSAASSLQKPASPTAARPVATPGVTPVVAALLADIRARDTGQLAVSEEDGRFLRMLVATSGVTHALEIGGASGYSSIWIGLGLRETGGRLHTIEYDPIRARELAANIRRAGLDDIVTVIPGDAFKEIPRIQGTFDFVFLDAWKRDYKRFFDMVYPRLDGEGLFVGHNVVNKRDELGDFLATIEQHPALFTTIVLPSGEGMSISYKRKRSS